MKPLPEARLVEWIGACRASYVEEGVLDGGVGSAIAALVMDHELDCRLLRIGVPCRSSSRARTKSSPGIYRLDADGIVARIDARWPR